MGILVATTGARGSYKDLPKIVRQKISKVSEVIHKQGIPVLSYIPPDTSGLSKIMLKPRSELSSGYDTGDCERINLLWHIAHISSKNIALDGQVICLKFVLAFVHMMEKQISHTVQLSILIPMICLVSTQL